jgi:hypothetical protein
MRDGRGAGEGPGEYVAAVRVPIVALIPHSSPRMSDPIFRLLFLASCGVVLAWAIWTAIFTLYPFMVGLPILH